MTCGALPRSEHARMQPDTARRDSIASRADCAFQNHAHERIGPDPTMVKVPASTYRLQLHGKTEDDPGFTFDDAAAIADYLQALGVTHVYSSPYLQAAPHSMHGYDVVDHKRVNTELGPELAAAVSTEVRKKSAADAHARFCKRLGEFGLGQVLDIVPNHMSLGEENRYWWDVLENGSNSRYASFFDIDWHPAEERLRDKVLVPVLGDQYGRVLNDGGIKVARQA